MISLKHINITFDRVIFNNASATFGSGRVNYLVGESGSGKTTLLNQLGLLSQCHCEYYFDDIQINQLSIEEKAKVRREKIGYVFQESNLIEGLSVYEHIKFIANFSGYDISHDEICEWIDKVKLMPYKDKLVEHLSGGQKQRIAIASALAKRPQLLLLDEPTAHLDRDNVMLIKDILDSIAKDKNVIIIVATHDLDLYKSERTYTLQSQKILYDKTSLYTNISRFHIDRSTQVIKKSIQYYNKKHQRKTSFYTSFITAIILSIAIFTQMYMVFYNSSMSDLVNNSFGEIRVYYGADKLKVYQELSKPISLTNINKIRNINGIKSVSPFYEFYGTTNHVSVVIQSYNNNLSLKTKDILNEDSRIIISNNLYEEIKHHSTIELETESKQTIKFGAVLEKQVMNRYSNSGENIIYVPLDYFKNEKHPIYMLLLNVEKDADIDEVYDALKRVDNDLTIYSPMGIDQLKTFNKNVVEKISQFSFIVLFMVFLFIIYDRSKELFQQKKELALLKANGSSSIQIFKILFLRYIKEIIFIDMIVCLSMCLFVIVFNFKNPLLIFKMFLFLISINIMIIFIPICLALILVNKREVIDLLS